MAIDLTIEGRHALLFDDDASAAFVNSRAALVPWTGDESLLIDRYDVRHLLDRIPPRLKKQRFVEDTGGVSQSELDRERFSDLSLSNDDDGDDDKNDKETTERSEAIGSGSYQAVPFSYGSNDGSADPNSSGQEHSAYHPPFSVPISLISNLPPTEKLHQIMARTAIFVSEHGGQSEIVLRVKQGDNPTFGFLMPNNQLHPYFRFLVDHHHLLKTGNTQEDKKSDDQESEALAAAGGALSLLGSLYGTGEDDDNTHQQKYEEKETSKPSAGGDSLSPHKSGREEPAPSVSTENREPTKRAIAFPTKEKTLLPKKNHFVDSGSITKKVEVTTSLHGVPNRASSLPSKTDVKPLILEPPSFLKKAIDKIVEFILKNGKEFEAILIEQDKTAGRFPFLLPANPFNPYYLKVLEEAKQSKSPSKKRSDKSKRRSQEATVSEATGKEELEDWYLDPQRKDKFKMTIGSKKEPNNQPSKPVKKSGVSTDEAAAIVLAATRGRSPAFQNSSPAYFESGQASNIHKPIPRPPVLVANAIAKTAAIATASEADSSDAILTKEQKLKAERLKRAKMFAAMIKSGLNPTTQMVQSNDTPNGSVGDNYEEREGSSVPFDAEFSGKDRNYRKRHHSMSQDDEEEEGEDSDEDRKHLRKKHHKHHHRHHHRHHKHRNDSESEDKHERSSRHRHRHRKRESSEDEERERSHKHRRKHRSPSEIEEGEIEVESKDAVDPHVEETQAKASELTEVPSDLRAKIRAMLLETI